MNNSFNIGTFNAGNAAVNLGGTIAGDQIGTQNQYINDPEVQGAIADLQTLLTQLQTQHPQVTSETQALAIIDAEFTEIKQSPTNKLATLRKQLLNPERHAQAIKATLGEIAKHYLEESVWAKATLVAIASPALLITLSTKSASKTATFAKAKVAATASSTKA